MHGDSGYKPKQNDSVLIEEFTITEIAFASLHNSACVNNNFGLLSGQTELQKNNYVGDGVYFNRNSGIIYANKVINKNINITLTSSSDTYNYKNVDILSHCRNSYVYTVRGSFVVKNGSPKYATIGLYDFDKKIFLIKSDVAVLQKTKQCEVSLTFAFNSENNNAVKLIVYSGKAGETANIESEYSNFSIIEHQKFDFIGLGKQWSHSR